jgi:hypothetical protein
MVLLMLELADPKFLKSIYRQIIPTHKVSGPV